MAGGIKSEYEKIKATDIFEFYPILDLWKEKQKREMELLKFKAKNRLL
jgi:hypothetical protein